MKLSPAVKRLIGRAVLAAVAAGVAVYFKLPIAAAAPLVGAILAGGELATPLNAYIGAFKKAEAAKK